MYVIVNKRIHWNRPRSVLRAFAHCVHIDLRETLQKGCMCFACCLSWPTYINHFTDFEELWNGRFTWCCRKVMRLAMLCTNQQCCCLPLHMAVRLTPAIDSVQVWTCYSCYTIVENIWSEVVFVRWLTKMDRQKFHQRCAIKFCVKLGESATMIYEKLQRLTENIPYPGHKCSDGTSPF